MNEEIQTMQVRCDRCGQLLSLDAARLDDLARHGSMPLALYVTRTRMLFSWDAEECAGVRKMEMKEGGTPCDQPNRP